MRAPAPLLESTGLTLRVAARTLVNGLDLRLAPGELWCLLGPNGAGKTTLLHTLVGLREAQGGEVRLSGRPLRQVPHGEAARLRGFLPQAQHYAFSASVLDTVMLGRHPYLARWQWEDEGDREIARAALGAMDLEGFDARDVLTLSGGERQRMALAALLVQDPPLLLLDEPLAHLDLHHQIMVLEHLARIAGERGKCALFTMHDLNLAARYADHALLLTPQGTARQGTIEEVMTEPELWCAFGHRVTRVEASGRTLFIPD